MKKLFILLALMLTATLSFAAVTVIENCDSAAGFAVYTTPPTGDSMTFATDTTNKTEGTGSLLVNYTYGTGNVWSEIRFNKAFASPVNLSQMEYLVLDLKNSTGGQYFTLKVFFQDKHNHWIFFDNSSALSTERANFETIKFKLSTYWQNENWGTGMPFDFAHVDKIYFALYRGANDTPAGTFSMNIDKIGFESGVNALNEVVLEDFESYADSTALQAAYASTNATLSTTNAYAGSKCMNLNMATITQNWDAAAVTKEFVNPVNLTNVSYFKVAIFGDAKFKTNVLKPYMRVRLTDSMGRSVFTTTRSWVEGTEYPGVNAEWINLFLGMTYPWQGDQIASWHSDGATPPAITNAARWYRCWEQERWDTDVNGNGDGWDDDCDFSSIKKISLGFQVNNDAANGAVFPTNDVNVKFDNLIAGFETFGPALPSDNSYNVAAISSSAAPVIDGAEGTNEWTAAGAGCTGFVKDDNPAVAATESPVVKALFDTRNLYIIYKVKNSSFVIDYTPTGDDPSEISFNGDEFDMYFAPGGNNMVNSFYHTILIPNQTDNICYVWDEYYLWGGPGSWSAASDSSAFTYNTTTQILTMEYKIPFKSFNMPGAAVSGCPANGTTWGVQLGFVNDNPSEAVNWEPDTEAGFASGRPFGIWQFTGVPPVEMSAKNWSMYE